MMVIQELYLMKPKYPLKSRNFTSDFTLNEKYVPYKNENISTMQIPKGYLFFHCIIIDFCCVTHVCLGLIPKISLSYVYLCIDFNTVGH